VSRIAIDASFYLFLGTKVRSIYVGAISRWFHKNFIGQRKWLSCLQYRFRLNSCSKGPILTIFRGLTDRHLRVVFVVVWDETALQINLHSFTMCHHNFKGQCKPFSCLWGNIRMFSCSKGSNMYHFPGHSPHFPRTNTALPAVKETKEHDKLQVNITREYWRFPILFILPGSTTHAGSRWYFRTVDPLFHHEHGLACGHRD